MVVRAASRPIFGRRLADFNCFLTFSRFSANYILTYSNTSKETEMNNEIGIAGWLYSPEILREKKMALLELPAACAAHGLSTVELCSAFFASQKADYLNELRSSLEDNGLTVHNIAVDMANLAGTDQKTRRTDIEALRQWFYTATAVGSRAIRINSGHAEDAEAMRRVVDGYRELVETASQAGVKLLMENHGGVSSYSNKLAEILNGVDSEWFGTCPDTGNFFDDDWEAGMRVLAPRAFSCHLKIFSLNADSLQSWIDRNGQERNCNLKESLQILKSAGYGGPFCLEQEAVSESAPKEQNISDTITFITDLIRSA